MTDKPMTKMAQRIFNKAIQSEELYPSGVARYLGYIESIIDRAFSDKVPAEQVIEQIEEITSRIRNLLAYPYVIREIERQTK